MISDDLFDDSFTITDEVKSYFLVDKENKENKLQWLTNTKDALLNQGRDRTTQQRENLAHYRGIDTRQIVRSSDDNTKRLNKLQRFIVNHLHDLTETKVSQMTRLKPSVEVLPTNNEWEDRASAKVVQYLIKHLWYINNIDKFANDMHRHCRIFGESYLFIDWNPNKGDLDPLYVEAKNSGFDQIKTESGQIIKLDKEIKTGDIEYQLELPWRVLLQRKNSFLEVDYLFRVKIEETDKLVAKYPKHEEAIVSDGSNAQVFDVESMTNRFLERHTVYYEFWHKKTANLPDGKKIVFVDNAILEENDHPFTHGNIPCVRLTDLDVPHVLNGVSRYEMILPMQNMYNNISTLISKNIYMMAHAKWMMPRGACKIDQLGNDNTIVQFQGPVAPQMAQTQPNPPEVYGFRQNIKEEMQVIYGSHGISRGEVPKGITAASALQFLNELENERATSDISKHGHLISELARMTVAVCGDKYDTTDGRLVRIVGEDNKFLIRHFDAANLTKDYDIRFDNSTGFPETKSAKIQRILDTMQRYPQLFSPERWEELLDLGNTEKMQTLATAAIQSADSESEDLLAGLEVAPPEEWEDHLAHWRSHSKSIQSRTFKEEATPEVRQAFIDHLRIHEMALYDKAATSPLLQAQLAQLPLFPLFYHQTGFIPQSEQQAQALVQGQANQLGQASTMIPGTDIDKQELQNRQ